MNTFMMKGDTLWVIENKGLLFTFNEWVREVASKSQHSGNSRGEAS